MTGFPITPSSIARHSDISTLCSSRGRAGSNGCQTVWAPTSNRSLASKAIEFLLAHCSVSRKAPIDRLVSGRDLIEDPFDGLHWQSSQPSMKR